MNVDVWFTRPYIWSESFVRCTFMHYLFRKVFCNIFFQKFWNYTPGQGIQHCACPYFGKIIYSKNTVFFVFAACHKHPLLIFSHSFSYCAHFYLFLPKCSDAHLCSIRLITYWNKNDVLKKIKLPKLYVCLKVSNKDTTGLLRVVQSENIWRCFCVHIDNFKQVSQIYLMCLFPNLSFFCMQQVPYCSALFKKNIVTYLDLLTLVFYCINCSKFMRRYLHVSERKVFSLESYLF